MYAIIDKEQCYAVAETRMDAMEELIRHLAEWDGIDPFPLHIARVSGRFARQFVWHQENIEYCGGAFHSGLWAEHESGWLDLHGYEQEETDVDPFIVAYYRNGRREVHTVGKGQVFNMRTGKVDNYDNQNIVTAHGKGECKNESL